MIVLFCVQYSSSHIGRRSSKKAFAQYIQQLYLDPLQTTSNDEQITIEKASKLSIQTILFSFLYSKCFFCEIKSFNA